MPVIREEEDIQDHVFHTDFSELLELPESAFPGSYDVLAGSTVAADALSQTCPAHPQTSDCLCNGFMGDWDLPEAAPDPYVGLEEPDYAKFENWIPQFVRPDKPCDYCRVRRLACYITRGEHGCTACNVLFRQCSLITAKAAAADQPPAATLLDTLHVVDEDAAREHGAVVGIKALRSKAGASGTRLNDSDGPTSSKRNGIRFPKHAVKILRDWLDAHADNPYPTEEEKVELEQRTELKPAQIANWLANARRRRKVTEKARPRLCASPSLRASTPAIDIPATEKPWDELNPFERWKNSPPENEPASMTDIANAVANSELPDDQISTSPSSLGRKNQRSSAGSGFSHARPASTTSFETRQTSSLSASTSAKYSQHSSHSHGSFGSFNSGLAGKKDRRRRRRPAPATLRKPSDEKKRIFQCTFCTDTFKSKYDWTRHEKSLHLSLEKWICAPLGPVITDPVSGSKRCVYCDEQNPADDHAETHNYRQCEEKGLDARTFYRKDHLRQHLRLMHSCEMTPFMDNWKSVAVNINSRCGFCAKRFTVWQERVDHLTAHFKAGVKMSEWKGCRGLDPAVAAQVTNAMPPYLIGIESVSPNPFSASNKATWRQAGSESGIIAPDLGNLSLETIQDQTPAPQLEDTGLPNKATCWEILTVRLGRYANKMSAQGVVLTDEMLQSEGRRILYDSDDTWNQTAADNPEWLDLFKKAHGLDFIPNAVGGQGESVPEDLETYGDLGLRIPFSVQLQALNQDQTPEQLCHIGLLDGEPNKSKQSQKVAELERVWMTLSKEGVLHDANGKCKHTECEDNILDASMISGKPASEPKHYRWCTYDLPPQQAKEIANLTKPLKKSKAPLAADGSPDSAERAARARNLSAMVDFVDRLNSQPAEHDSGGAAARAKAQALEALTHAECCGGMVERCIWNGATKKQFMQRHLYELPAHRAQQFATTTGPWEDSGNMPPAISTASIDLGPNITSTGAMMEFLGPDLGATLPFSTDAMTSTIPISSELNWTIPTSAADEAAMMEDVDRLIAETTPPETQLPFPGDFSSGMTSSAEVPSEMVMDDLNFDMEMDFDGVFDMPMDETFGPQN